MIWPVLLVDGKYCGPVIEPAGPMIWSTWLGVKRADLHGPVERHVERARRAVGDQVPSAPSPPGTEVLRTCGPGTIKRQGVLIERGLRMLVGAQLNVTRHVLGRQVGRGDRVDIAGVRPVNARRHRVLVGRAIGILIDRVDVAERRMPSTETHSSRSAS